MMDIQQGGGRDGDVGVWWDPAMSGTYIGGMPFGINASGLCFGSAVNNDTYQGLLLNNSAQDTQIGSGDVGTTTFSDTTTKPTVVWADGFKAKLWKGERHQHVDAAAPWEGVTWAVGEDIYVSANGKLTNVSGAGLTIRIGKVITAPASADDIMTARFYPKTAVDYHG